jgi:hypothetical protein
LEFWDVRGSTEYHSKQAYRCTQYRKRFLFLSRQTGEAGAGMAVNSRTERTGKTMPIQLCAHSIIVDFESTEVLWARQRPAQRASGALEWSREFIRAVHFEECGEGSRDSAVREARMYGRCRTA